MGLNCPEEKGKEVSSQRTEQGSAAGQRKKLRCLLEYFVMMLIQPFTPILLSIFTPPSPICIYIIYLTVLHFIIMVLDTVLSLAAF